MINETPVLTENIIKFLQQVSSYPHHPTNIEIKQTHTSVVAIAPPYVFKVKKPIKLSFLDFTSLDRRKSNSERERLLNSRFCPELYLGVLPISVKQNYLTFGAGDRIVDYALQMKHLPDGYFLDQLLLANQVTCSTLDAIMTILKTCYKTPPPENLVEGYGSLEEIRKTVEENLETLQQHAGDLVHPTSLKAIQFYLQRFLADNKNLFEKRVQELRIRDCHGDLHLDHIHIREGNICIFDCIEFNDRYRFIDVASDIAFLAMDFDFQGRPDLSAYLTTGMAGLLKDPELELLSNFYKCYRACVRAKVESIKSQETEVAAPDRELSREKVQRYVSLGLSYALFHAQPAVLLVGGRSGSGKTTLAKKLAALLGWKHLSSDVIRKVQTGLPLYQRPNPRIRAELYSKSVTDQVYQVMLDETLAQIKNYKPVILDATFGQPKHRAIFVQALNQLGVPYYFLVLKTSDEEINKRLAQRDNNNREVSDARLEDFDLLRQIYQEPTELLPTQLINVNAGLSSDEITANVISQLQVKKVIFS